MPHGAQPGRGIPAILLALAVVLFPLARHPAEASFIAAVVAAAYLGWPGADDARARRIVLQGNALVLITAWVVLRTVPPWGVGTHTLLDGRMLYPATALDYLVLLWGLYLLSWHRFRPRDVRLFCWAIVGATVIHVALTVGQVYLNWYPSFTWDPFGLRTMDIHVRPARLGRATGTHRIANLLGMSAFVGLVAAATLLRWERSRSHRRCGVQVGLAIVIVGATWAIYQAGSRITWLAGLLFFLGATYFASRWIRGVVVVLVFVLGFSVLLAVTNQGSATEGARRVVPEIVWGRIIGSDDVPSSGLSWRLHVWDCGLDLVRERPITGIGLGRYGPECEERLAARIGRPVRTGALNHAHNLELQMAAELGVPFTLGAAAWVLWVLWPRSRCVWGRSGTRGVTHAEHGHGIHAEDRLLRSGVVVLVAGVLLISQVNLIVAHDHEPLVVLVIALAMLASPALDDVGSTDPGDVPCPTPTTGRTA